MRIKTNFAPPRLNLVPWLFGVVLVASAVAVVLTTGSVVQGLEARSELPAIQERLAKLDERLAAEPRRTDLPTHTQLAALRARVAALNGVGSGRGLSVTGLLARLEALLPDRVVLVSLHQRRREGVVQLIAEAPTADPLTAFLKKLEQDPQFAEVLLVRQVPASDRTGMQFDLRLKERLG